MFNQELKNIAESINEAMAELRIPVPEKVDWTSTPFSGEWGYGTTACFQSAALEARSGKRIDIRERAQEIAEILSKKLEIPKDFSHIEAINGYLNIYIDPEKYALRVVDTILTRKQSFGKGDPIPERVMVEFSQPNTHKAFHVGHLRNLILGGALSNILAFAGFDTIRANYLGDIGWHVIKWLWCYLKYHTNEEPQGDRTRWMQDIYSEATRLVEENPEYEAEARKIFARWDAQDTQLVELWQKTRQWSIEGFKEIYDILGEKFDVFFYESEFEEPGKVIVEDLIKRGLAVDERPSGGPVVIKLDEILNLSKETYRVLVLLRSDGTSLYATKDLPLAIRKFEEWRVDRSIYVIDVRQSLYLKQIFKTLELMGYDQAKKCYHFSYEIVNLPGNVTMSSREGTVVMFDDLLEEAFARAVAIIDEKNPDLDPSLKVEVSRTVALGALKYPLLAVDNNKIATFDWDRALDFEGQASPYIQYAHVRANSILTRAGELPTASEPSYELHPAEIELLDRLSQFPEMVKRSAADYKPLLIANYVYELAQDFTSFYQHCPVLQAEPAIRNFRLRLTAAARQVLANGLNLLGISTPDVM
jgi:arginyl-tRNA synthetase